MVDKVLSDKKMTGSKRQKQRQARRLQILSDAQVALGWLVIVALAALVGAIYLSQASRIASVGRKVQILQNDLEEVKRENAELERSIAGAQSLERLQVEAERLGFTRAGPEDIEYLVVDEYPAAEADIDAEENTGDLLPAPPATIGEAIWAAARARFSNLMTGDSGE